MRDILLVDDEPDVGDVVSVLLSHHGYRVAAVRRAHDAIDRIAHGLVPAAVVLDLVLPDMDALSFLVRARRDRVLTAVPVIALSGHPISLDQIEPLVYATLLKPLVFTTLVETIHRACARMPPLDTGASKLPPARRRAATAA